MIEKFTRDTGIVVHQSYYASNEELLAKLQAGATGYDLAIPSDYMVGIMAKLGLLQALDMSAIPNSRSIEPRFVGLSYDSTNTYSLPFAWTITGIAVNRERYSNAISGWKDLASPMLKGKFSLLDDVREAMGMALKANGYSLNSTSPEELQKARQTLLSLKPNAKTFSSAPRDLLLAHEVDVAHDWAQDALRMAHETGRRIEFVAPEEGGPIAIDNMVILKDAPHAKAAHVLLNYLLDKEASADFVKRVYSAPVVKGVKDLLPAELQNSPFLFPDDATFAKFEMMRDLKEATAQYDSIWTSVKASR